MLQKTLIFVSVFIAPLSFADPAQPLSEGNGGGGALPSAQQVRRYVSVGECTYEKYKEDGQKGYAYRLQSQVVTRKFYDVVTQTDDKAVQQSFVDVPDTENVEVIVFESSFKEAKAAAIEDCERIRAYRVEEMNKQAATQ